MRIIGAFFAICAIYFVIYIVMLTVGVSPGKPAPGAFVLGGTVTIIVIIYILLKLRDLLKHSKNKLRDLKDLLPETILLVGAFLFALRLFFPPKRFPYSSPDFYMAMVHGLGIAAITVAAYYYLIKIKKKLH